MKKIFLPFILFLLFLSFSFAQEIENVSDDDKLSECSFLYTPVCWVNNKTYTNKCFLEKEWINLQYDWECNSKEEIINCKVYFDWCNTCNYINWKKISCSELKCKDLKEAKCLKEDIINQEENNIMAKSMVIEDTMETINNDNETITEKNIVSTANLEYTNENLTPISQFCIDRWWKIQNNNEKNICLFPNWQCEESLYFNNKCNPFLTENENKYYELIDNKLWNKIDTIINKYNTNDKKNDIIQTLINRVEQMKEKYKWKKEESFLKVLSLYLKEYIIRNN